MSVADRKQAGAGAGHPPERWWGRHLAETRWTLEASRLLLDPVFLPAAGVPRGDGRAVVLVPGFLAGDQTLLLLAGWLKRIGHRPALCGFTFNVDCANRALDRVEAAAEDAFTATGRRVAAIGHSRGGHLVRALAAKRPDLVSHAVSLGADLQGLYGISTPTRAAVGVARTAMEATRRTPEPQCFRRACGCAFSQAYRGDFPTDRVRLTSVFSKGDGVVRWPTMLVDEARCVEVTGSHVGLPMNRKAFRAIADALAEAELGAGDRP